MLFFGKFYVTKKSKSVEIVFGKSKAMSGSIIIKIRQPFLWTDPYLHCLRYVLDFASIYIHYYILVEPTEFSLVGKLKLWMKK